MSLQRCRFGLFEFDLASRELRREGAVLRLQAQPAEVLACLLVNAGNVVSREELRRTVWNEDTFVDFERGLNFCIAQIRATLDDDAAAPRFIRTLPKRGYQFIAPVDRQPDVLPKESQPSSSPALPSRDFWAAASRFGRLATAGWLIAAIAVLILVFAAGYWFSTRVGAKSNPIVAVFRFDNETGDPSISRFSDNLTDALVADLTQAGDGHYRVIGNAQALRLPREQRNLTVIASSLGASYVILGQVQFKDGDMRVLAHLIHLPEQTHVWVSRVQRGQNDASTFESQVTHALTAQFSPRIAAGVTSRISSPTANR